MKKPIQLFFYVSIILAIFFSACSIPPSSAIPINTTMTGNMPVNVNTPLSTKTLFPENTLVPTNLPSPTNTAFASKPTEAGPQKQYKDMTLCFSQIGDGNSWMSALTASIKENAAKLHIKKLTFSDALWKPILQTSAIQSCIKQGVNVIAFDPVSQDGWSDVLSAAKKANIPVIVLDQPLKDDPDLKALYATHLGPNNNLEGNRAAEEMNKLLPDGGTIVELSGINGSPPATNRAVGFREKLNNNILILDSQPGDFTSSKGKTVMKKFLTDYKGKIQGIYSHNDDMAAGAISAMKEAGLKPGEIKIVSIDGSRVGFQAMIDGWVQADVECSPFIGAQFLDLALKLMNGETVSHDIDSDETVFHPEDAKKLISTRWK